jgi:crotonobetainyl-CoA:carnitine CoA-transferase CaiB-like acyl-CoA transferase
MYKPLEGIKVIDFCLAGSGPSCTKLLAEFGANVIWVEPLTGSSTRTVHKFDFYTTGKRAITLDLKTPEGHEAILRIIKAADVFVTNYRPRAVKKLGLDYESLSALKPELIYGTLTGFGTEGAEANDAGYDPVAFWAKSGMLVDFAEKDSLLVPPIAIGDIATGVVLMGGITTALYGREKTGRGCHVITSLLGSAAYINHDALIETQYGEEYPKSRLTPRRAMLNTYQCKDGKWFVLSIANDFERYFNRLLTDVIDRPDLVGSPRYRCIEDTMYEKAPEFVAILDEAFGKMTRDKAIAKLKAIDAPVNVVQNTKEFLRDPQAMANKYFYELEATEPPDNAENPQIWVPASPIKLNDLDSGIVGNQRGPRLGEHSIEILKEYGYSDEEISEFLEKKVTSQSEGTSK